MSYIDLFLAHRISRVGVCLANSGHTSGEGGGSYSRK